MADELLTEWVSMDQQAGQSFVKEKLNDLGQRQADLEHGLAEVQQEMDSMERDSVDTDLAGRFGSSEGGFRGAATLRAA